MKTITLIFQFLICLKFICATKAIKNLAGKVAATVTGKDVTKNKECKAIKMRSEEFYTKFFKEFTDLKFDLPSRGRLAKSYSCRDEELVAAAEGTRVIFHGDLDKLFNDYLKEKRNLYPSNEEFVQHLLEHRPYTFYSNSDKTLQHSFEGLRDNMTQITLGRRHDSGNINYDEVLFSSLLLVSSPTKFYNDCNRYNEGKTDNAIPHHEKGIIIGVVGPRFEKENLMDYKFMIVKKGHNKKPEFKNPIESILYNYYFTDDMPWKNFDLAFKDKDRYEFFTKKINENTTTEACFDKYVYRKRLRLVALPYFADANERAQQKDTKAYVHVPGWGLGAWMAYKDQSKVFLQEILNLITEMFENGRITHISDIYFEFLSVEDDQFDEILQKVPEDVKEAINFTSGKIPPASKTISLKLNGEKEKLLVLSYPWDGNSYPGNEYWIGNLTESGDPAAASCSDIADLQNPEINIGFTRRIKVYEEKRVKFKNEQSSTNNLQAPRSRLISSKTVYLGTNKTKAVTAKK